MASKKNELIPVATLDGSCVWVPSKDAAVLTALEKMPYGSQEFAGAIYKNNKGEYCYSVPVSGTNDNFQFKTDKSGGNTFDGIYHSHPGGPHEEKFSLNDISVADQLKRTSYIRANDSGEVKRYDPGVSAVSANKRPGSMTLREKTSAGTSLGNLKKPQLAELIGRAMQSNPDTSSTDSAQIIAAQQLMKNGQ